MKILQKVRRLTENATEHDIGVVDKGPGDRNALLLTH